MSSTSWFAPAPPSVAIEIASRRVTVAELGRSGGTAVVSGYATEPLPADAVDAGAHRRRTSPQPAVVADALRRALDRAGIRGAAPRRAGRARQRRARVAAPVRAAAGQGGRPRSARSAGSCSKATPFPIDEAQVTLVSRARGRHRHDARRRRRAPRRDRAVRGGDRRPPGIHAGIVDLASFNVMNAVMSAGAASPGDWLVVSLAAEGDDARDPARPRLDVLPPSRRGRRGAAQRARAPDGDVSRGSAGRDAVRARVAVRVVVHAGRRRRGAPRDRAIGWACRPKRSTSGPPRRSATGSPCRSTCSTRWRRRSACCCASGRRPDHAARQSLHAAVLQRATGHARAAARRGRDGGAGDLQRHADRGALAPSARRSRRTRREIATEAQPRARRRGRARQDGRSGAAAVPRRRRRAKPTTSSTSARSRGRRSSATSRRRCRWTPG